MEDRKQNFILFYQECNKKEKYVVKAISTSLTILSIALSSMLFLLLFNWFISDAFMLNKISFIQAIAISAIIKMLRFSVNEYISKMNELKLKSEAEKIIEKIELSMCSSMISFVYILIFSILKVIYIWIG